jgi:hypothetical protein
LILEGWAKTRSLAARIIDKRRRRKNMSELKSSQKQLLFLIIGSIGLFILNNFVLGAYVSRYLGGSDAGLTSMVFITFAVLSVRKQGAIPLVYATYGAIGAVSHLMAGDTGYLLAIALLAGCGFVFNWFLHKRDYAPVAFVVAFPVFVILLRASIPAARSIIGAAFPSWNQLLGKTALTVVLGYLGMLAGFVAYKKMANRPFIAGLRPKVIQRGAG